MKELKHYAHFYLGCQVMRNDITGKLSEIDIDNNIVTMKFWIGQNISVPIDEVKLILRPLSDMTEEEKKEYNHRKQRKGYMPEVHADNTLWLLSKGFDIFGLIHAGLAISKTETKN